MLEALSKGFRTAKQKLQGISEITAENIDPVLRDVRLSLLEADVELGVAKQFLARVRDNLVGQTFQTKIEGKGRTIKIGPQERFIHACQSELVAMMDSPGPAVTFAAKPKATGIMMVGLQGAGKTTTAGKLAKLLESQGRKCLLVAADVQRPGAIQQLETLGEKIDVPVFSIPGGQPLDICTKAVDYAKKLKRDTIIFDTAGRLAIDDALMVELSAIKDSVRPENVFMVVDAMIGQDAVRTAATFNERLSLTGFVLTKLDGDARGGAALSIREVTGAPVKFVGMGESMDRLEEFRADGLASRILGFGDVASLMKDFEQVVDEKKAEADAKRMLSGKFTFDDFLEQIRMIQGMGPIQDLLEKVPFFQDSVPQGFQLDNKDLKRIEAVISSMTPKERRDPDLFTRERGRVSRVAKGSGRTDKDVLELLQRFTFMKQMMGGIGQQAGMMSRIPGMKQLAMARQLKNAVSMQGMEGNPMMANLAAELFESAVADGGSANGAGTVRKVDKDKKKHLRKLEKKARRKSRK